MNIVVTSIGSMSAACVISSLKKLGHFIVGTDIYPQEWHSEPLLCDKFYKIPLCIKANYIKSLKKIVFENQINCIIPLTDIEIDVLDKNRHIFDTMGVIICMPSHDVLKVVRDKFNLYNFFKFDNKVLMPKTFLATKFPKKKLSPLVAKPRNGRSSEGLFWINTPNDLQYILNKENYIIQEKIVGTIITVDFIRNERSLKSIILPRKELLRTSNGAGITVEMFTGKKIVEICNLIGTKLNINGCVNFEFIHTNGLFYLIDINPRFSAGIAFSHKIGYDLPKNHLFCFTKKNIDSQKPFNKQIITKKHVEQVLQLSKKVYYDELER